MRYEELVTPRGLGASDDQIRTLAAFAEVSELPSEYVDLLRFANGSQPIHDRLRVETVRGVVDTNIERFFASDRQDYSAMSHTDDLRRQARLVRTALAIAGDYDGNCLLLSLETQTFGAVLFWDHEQGDKEPSPGDSIADFPNQIVSFFPSIRELLAAFRPDDHWPDDSW